MIIEENNVKYCLNCGKILIKRQKNFCSRDCMHSSIIYRNKLSASGKKKIFSEEHRKHLGETKKGNTYGCGHIVSDAHKQKLREINTGKKTSEESKEKNRQAHIGKKATKETKEKMSTMRMGHIVSEDTKRKISVIKTGKKMSPEAVLHMSVALKGKTAWNKGKKMSVDARHNMSVSATGRKLSDTAKRKVGDFFRGKTLSNDHKQKIKDSWKDATVAKARLGGGSRRPNKIEKILLDVLNSVAPNTWIYVGDGSLVVGGKCPDYVNVENNKLIELFGDYWHRGENPQDRIDYFEKCEYKTLVIWEKDVRKNVSDVINKVVEFTYGKTSQLMTRVLQN